MSVEIDIRDESGEPLDALGDIEGDLGRFLGILGEGEGELSIVFCDDKAIARLNEQYRQVVAPTDVLAFSQSEGRSLPGQPVLGDLVISIPRAREQAMEAGHDLAAETRLLLAHGLLHLLGFDHTTPDEERRMNAETDRLLKGIGLHITIPNSMGGEEDECG